jgi:hypothetical protein
VKRLPILTFVRKNPFLLIFLFATFVFHSKNIFELGPTWDDWYYPANFNLQIQEFNRDSNSFSTGYGLGGFTFIEIFTRLLTLNFGVYSEDSFEAMVARRILLLALSYFGALVTYWIILNLGYSKQLAKCALVLLITLPNWIGQASINVKDIPVAVGMVMLVDGLIRVKITQHERVNKKVKTLILGELFLGFYISFGTRFGLIVFIAVAIVYVFMGNRKRFRKNNGISNASVLGILTCSYLFLIPLNPIILNPVDFLPKAIFGTLSLYQQLAGPVLTAGILVDGNSPPHWYLPSWTLAQMPMTHTILFLISVLLIGFGGVKVLRRTQKISSPKLRDTFLFALLTIGPYLSAIVLLPPLYDGDRQFIMAYPFLVFVMLTCVVQIRESVKPKFSSYLLSTLILVTLVSPGVSLISSSPFTYSFRNEIISHPEDWEGDYMGVSLRQAAKSTATISLPLAYDHSDERWLVTWNQVSKTMTPNSSTEKFLYIATRRGLRNSIPKECVELEHVGTKFLNKRNILSFVGICKKEKVGK